MGGECPQITMRINADPNGVILGEAIWFSRGARFESCRGNKPKPGTVFRPGKISAIREFQFPQSADS
jgi:hypothetical protein